MDNVDSFLQNICRTCAVQTKNEIYTQLFVGPTSFQVLHENAWAELMEFNLQISSDDGLPQQICSRCLDNFIFIVQFREQCNNAQEVLEALYERKGTSNSDLITCAFDPNENPATRPETQNITDVIENVNSSCEEDQIKFNNGSTSNIPDNECNRDIKRVPDIEFSVPNDYVNLPLKVFAEEIDIKRPKKKVSRKGAIKEYFLKDLIKAEEKEECSEKVTCKYCDKVCKSSRGFLLHKDKCDAFNAVNCRICTIEFENKEQLEKHKLDSHPDGGDPMCPICSQTFADCIKRDYHIRQTHDNGQYTCAACDKVYKSKLYLIAHINRYHSGESECKVCNQKFTNASKLRYHWTNTHAENMKHKCEYCDKLFISQFAMRTHQRSHTGERPFLCSKCGASFRYRHIFVEHMKTHDSKQTTFQCDICELIFLTRRRLNHHKRKHTRKPHKCEACDASFSYKLDLYTHRYNEHKLSKVIRKRETDYPFKCPQCDRGFPVYRSLSKHLKTHMDNDRKHICIHCGNRYKRSDHLNLHIKRVHLKITQYKCEICGKEYLEKGPLKAHMIVHDDARPFACKKCPASFKRERALKDHMFKHEDKREYACDICDMRFFNPTVVTLHTQRVHLDSQKKFMSELLNNELEDAHMMMQEKDECVEVLREKIKNR